MLALSRPNEHPLLRLACAHARSLRTMTCRLRASGPPPSMLCGRPHRVCCCVCPCVMTSVSSPKSSYVLQSKFSQAVLAASSWSGVLRGSTQNHPLTFCFVP